MKSNVLKFLVVLFTVLLCSCSKGPSPMRFALITDTPSMKRIVFLNGVMISALNIVTFKR